MDGRVGQASEHLDAAREVVFFPCQRNLDVRSQGIGINGSDENCGGRLLRSSDAGKRPLTQSRPDAGLQQQSLDLIGGKFGGRLAGEGLEGDRLAATGQLVLIEFDHHGLQSAAFSAVDADDATAGRRRIAHAGRFLIVEEQLAALDFVAFLRVHRRLHADVIGGQQRHAGRLRRLLDRLLGLAGNRQVKTFSDRESTHVE